MATGDLDDRGVIVACASCGQKNRLAFARLSDAVRCAKCHQLIPPPASPVEVPDTAAFDRAVAESTLPIVVDYWAPWCGPCRMVAPELQKVASRQAGRLLVLKVNTDVLTDLGARYRIQSIPTLAVFNAGREVGRTSGARPAADIEAFVSASVSRA